MASEPHFEDVEARLYIASLVIDIHELIVACMKMVGHFPPDSYTFRVPKHVFFPKALLTKTFIYYLS